MSAHDEHHDPNHGDPTHGGHHEHEHHQDDGHDDGHGNEHGDGHNDGHGHGHDDGHGRQRTVERYCDVAVIGGSAAGLAAALQLARQRRSVIVVDAGEPRNAPAAHMHGYLGHEGMAPSEFSTIGRDEVRSYGVEVLAGRVVTVDRDGSASAPQFRVELESGNRVVARRVLAATGLVDELPAIDGLAEHWGRDVIHCPFCHGYEVRDQRVVQIVTHPMGLHPAPLFRQLTDRLSVVVQAGVDVDVTTLDRLRAAGVHVANGEVSRVVTGDDGRVAGVELRDGSRLDADAIVVGPQFRVRAEPLAALGLEPIAHQSGLGDHITTTPTGETTVPGVFAAGNLTDPSQQVLHAAANGSWVGAMISFSLADEDVSLAGRPSANEADWDHRYSGDRLWSGNPNGTLVHEVNELPAGRALDVGAGEGGDAVWLAEQGWDVTASDISPRGLGRVAAAAAERGLDVGTLHADANTSAAYGGETFDLVSAFYASIPRTPDRVAVHNLLASVAPGGTLLVVSHDLEEVQAGNDATSEGRVMAFDPDAYVRVEDFVDVLTSSPGWEIEIHERRDRPPGAASGGHHVRDIVLRARRQ